MNKEKTYYIDQDSDNTLYYHKDTDNGLYWERLRRTTYCQMAARITHHKRHTGER